ncbi:MAG: FKBP-type peptidyl-prolyl cis-trans isomerase [Muribaculaceae bacterium]|nr:FKBP-type peptidyl-prolyl cis-trans isomerase [Muribaculaceae bacterium]
MKAINLIIAGTLLIAGASSCIKGEMDDYDAWRVENDKYVSEIDLEEYQRVAPDWAPENEIFIKWHNDRSLTANNLVPISTSTIKTKYELENINGVSLGNSYTASSGDSVYQTVPNANIVGFWAAVTMMHVGDSVTVIIPYMSAYGNQTRGSITPFSNLIYRIKLKEVVNFERPSN